MARYSPLFALAAVALIVSLGLAIAPAVHVGNAALAAIVFGGATLTSIGAVHVASIGWLGSRATLVVGGVALCVLACLAALHARNVAAGVVVDVAIVAFAHAAGASIGRRIEDAGHLLPAMVVVACVDIVSVLHPNGPTHQVLDSERAMAVMVFAFPVPGVSPRVLAPALGVGDLVIVALVLAAAHAHRLPHVRIAVAALVGALVAGAGSLVLQAPVPALPAIAAAILAVSPAMRRLRPKDRTAALGGMVIAVVVALFVVASRFLGAPVESSGP